MKFDIIYKIIQLSNAAKNYKIIRLSIATKNYTIIWLSIATKNYKTIQLSNATKDNKNVHFSIATWYSIKINDYQSKQAFVLRLEVIGNWTSQNCFAILFANLQMSHKILFLLTVIYFYIGRKMKVFLQWMVK